MALYPAASTPLLHNPQTSPFSAVSVSDNLKGPQLDASTTRSPLLQLTAKRHGSSALSPMQRASGILWRRTCRDCCTRLSLALNDCDLNNADGSGRIESSSPMKERYTAVYLLIAVNLVLFAMDHIAHLPWIKLLYLNHNYAHWWQYLTCNFCHGGWDHLSNNMFMLYAFGKMVEEKEGGWGLVSSYVICGIVSGIVSKIVLGAGYVSLGASGSVFGLLVVGLLSKARFNWRVPIEMLAVGPFVWQQISREIAVTVSQKGSHMMAGGNVNHVAHLAGAATAGALVWFGRRVKENRQ